MSSRPVAFDAVVLAGGTAARLGGEDKMLLEVGGVRLIDRALAAVAAARRRVVVGPRRPDTAAATWLRESPPGGGPVAALAAGLTAVESEVVVLLAADLPFVAERHVADLLSALEAPVEGVLYVDADGYDQPLLSAWHTAALRAVLPPDPVGHGLRRILAPLTIRRLPGDDDLIDCDTPAEVATARQRAGDDGSAGKERSP